MQALTFWKTVAVDRENHLETILDLLKQNGIRYCVVGGQAVNAYVEPLVSLGLDLAVASGELRKAEIAFSSRYPVERFPHSLNVTFPGSDLRIQIQTDPRYGDFVERAVTMDVLGLPMPVASLEDLLAGKIWAVQDAGRRGSKRQKDLADIARILEAYPQLRSQVPAEILERLL